MSQIVEVPGYGQVEFPDGMADKDIELAIRKNMLRADAPKPGTTKPLDAGGGKFMTERSITVQDPRLNSGKATNIPSVWGGKVVSDDEAVDNALRSGRQWDSFGSIDEAVASAKSRSDALGRGQQSIGGARVSTAQERFVASPLARFASGVATPAVGLAQMAVEPFMGGDQNPVTRNLRELQAMQARGGHEGMDIAGGVGQVVGPMGVASKIPMAASLLGRMGQGAAIGAGLGVTQPVMEGSVFGAKPGQAASGAAVGAAMPALTAGAGKVLHTGRNIVDGFVPERVKWKILDEAAGPKRAEIMQGLQNPQIVPGTQIGAGEAAAPAGRAEFSALQRVLEPLQPSAYRDMQQASNAARVGAVRTVGQDEAALKAAEATRSANANVNYAQAYQQAIRGDPQLALIASSEYYKEALPKALKLAKEQGINPKAELTKFLHLVKQGLDDRLDVPAGGLNALGRSERKVVSNVKDRLVDWMGKKNKAYDAARKQFAADSVPINQMQVGQALENKLTSALDDAPLRAQGFAEAVRNPTRLLNQATHFKGNEKLSDVLDPSQVTKITSVADDLSRRAQYEDLARKGQPAALEIMGASVPKAPPTYLLKPELTLTRAIINHFQGKLSEKAMQQLAVDMQNPQRILQIMNQLPPQSRAQVVQDFLQMSGRMGAVAGGASQ
jgi:hypothetical protein